MKILVSSGTGTGPTKLAAFDAALNSAGVANYNLIRLSSVIPPKAEVVVEPGKIAELTGEWGDRLYVVLAEMRVDTPNVEAWAGIGWVQDEANGKGLFVEHEGKSEAAVRNSIQESLQALMATRGQDMSDIQMEVVGTTCSHEPVCALVVAVFESVSWEGYGTKESV